MSLYCDILSILHLCAHKIETAPLQQINISFTGSRKSICISKCSLFNIIYSAFYKDLQMTEELLALQRDFICYYSKFTSFISSHCFLEISFYKTISLFYLQYVFFPSDIRKTTREDCVCVCEIYMYCIGGRKKKKTIQANPMQNTLKSPYQEPPRL